MAYGFKPINHNQGKEMSLPMTAATTLTKHYLCKMSSGYLVAGAAGDNEVEYIALQTKTSGASDGEMIDVLPIDGDTKFEMYCSTTPVQATHVGNDYDISNSYTVNLGATTDKVVHIDSIKDATNKLVIARFNKPSID